MVGRNRGEQVVGTDTTNAEGQFSFTGLEASEFVVELLSGDDIVPSAPLTLTEGAMQVRGASISQPSNEGGMSTGAKVAIGVGVGVGVGALLLIVWASCQGRNPSGPCG